MVKPLKGLTLVFRLERLATRDRLTVNSLKAKNRIQEKYKFFMHYKNFFILQIIFSFFFFFCKTRENKYRGKRDHHISIHDRVWIHPTLCLCVVVCFYTKFLVYSSIHQRSTSDQCWRLAKIVLPYWHSINTLKQEKTHVALPVPASPIYNSWGVHSSPWALFFSILS